MSKDNKRLSKENKNLDYKLKHQVERNVIVVNQVRNLKGQIKELKANIVEKEPHLDYLQRTNDQLFNSLEEAKDAYVDGFKLRTSRMFWISITLRVLKIFIRR